MNSDDRVAAREAERAAASEREPIVEADAGDLSSLALSDGLRLYLSEISRIPLLSAHRELELARRVEVNDREARNKVIEANLRLVVSIAKRYVGEGLALEDVVGEGNIGIIRAVSKFDPSKGFRIYTHSTWWIT